MKRSAIIVLSVMTFAFIQGNAAAQDFLISREDTTCDFSHSDPILFSNGSHGFLVVWADTRNGPSRFYAQRFDSLCHPVGKNFPFYSNSDVAFSPNGTFLAERDYYFSMGSGQFQVDRYNLLAAICNSDGTCSTPIQLADVYLPFDCIGVCIGLSHDLAFSESGYVSAFDNGGSLTLFARDWAGNNLWTRGNSNAGGSGDTIHAASVSISINPNQCLAAVWVNVQYWDPYADTIHQIIGTFLNGGGDTLAANVVLRSETPANIDLNWWQHEKVKVLPLSPDLYEIFDYDGDSFTLHYWTVDTAGNRIGDMNELDILHDMNPAANQSQNTSSFGFTPVVNGRFSLLLTVREPGSLTPKYYNSLLSFDTAGTLVGPPITDSTSVLNIGDDFYRLPDSTLIIPIVEDHDVYLGEYHGLSLAGLEKVNDNLPGSNDMLSSVVPLSDGNFFTTWTDEKNAFGREVGTDGVTFGQTQKLGEADLGFFPDGSSVGLWMKAVSDSMYGFGYTLYDKAFSATEVDTLARSVYWDWLFGVKEILPDSSLMILYRDGISLKLRHILANGEFKEVTIPNASYPWWLGISPVTDTTFWINYNGDITLMSESMNLLGVPHSIGLFSSYLGKNKFLKYLTTSPTPGSSTADYYGTIVNQDDSTLVGRFAIDDSMDSVTSLSFNEIYFAVAYRKGNQVFLRTYDTSGAARVDPIPVSGYPASAKTGPSLSMNGNSLLVAWSEARSQGKGYDVYGRIFDIGKLTPVKSVDARVPSRFTLYQNYPNPFNPSTTISYDVPVKAQVTVVIYNVLGEKIATLVDGVKNTGSYLTVFNGSRFASGVYFCRMTAGQYTFTRKLMMLK
jgi:Secretion system C-terminal sorting domain